MQIFIAIQLLFCVISASKLEVSLQTSVSSDDLGEISERASALLEKYILAVSGSSSECKPSSIRGNIKAACNTEYDVCSTLTSYSPEEIIDHAKSIPGTAELAGKMLKYGDRFQSYGFKCDGSEMLLFGGEAREFLQHLPKADSHKTSTDEL